MIPEEYIQVLTQLELTLLQAKAYLNLTRLGKADVNTISKASNLARTDAYRVMTVLEHMGLAEKIIDKKTVYKATPIKEGMMILLKNKKHKDEEIERKSKLLLNRAQTDNLLYSQTENQQFIITSESSLFRKRFERSLEGAESCKMILPAAGVKYAMYYFFEELKNGLKRGAKIQVIAEKTDDADVNRKLLSLAKNALFKIRFASAPRVNFAVTVFNDKEVDLCISSNSEVPSLHSNNAQVVEEAQMLFESIWKKSKVGSEFKSGSAGKKTLAVL